MIPKKFLNVPWCEYIIPLGDKGEFGHTSALQVGDTGKIVMNVNLLNDDYKEAVWGKFRVTKVIHENFYEGVRIE